MDLAPLLEPVTGDDPAGPDLSYDPGRQAIESAFDGSDDAPDWDRVVAMIEAQARQTRDIWLAVYLMRAGARAGQLATVADGAELLAGLFERFWDGAHPTIEEYGIESRKGACESLVRIAEFLAPLRNVPLLTHPRLGRFTGIDFRRFADEGPEAPGYADFRIAVAEEAPEHFADAIATLQAIAAAVERADEVLSSEAAAIGQTGTNFRPTYEAIEQIIAAIRPYAAVPGLDASPAPPTEATASPSPVPAAAKGDVTAVESRADVARVLDAVIAYYARAEPSSPIPLALARIKGWIASDFMSILADIAPNGRSDAMAVLGGAGEERRNGSDMM